MLVMDLNAALAITARRYIAPVLVVVLLLGSSMAYIWEEYKTLLKERKVFTDEVVRFQKNNADAAIVLNTKKTELEKREFVLHQQEEQYREKLVALQKRASEYEVAFGKLQGAQSSVSQAQRQKEVEDKIQILMSQFSAMGVDLNDSIRCGDASGLIRFNAAKAKYSEIYTLAEANGLTKRFNTFFNQMGQHNLSSCLE
jgi:hypothetical protein